MSSRTRRRGRRPRDSATGPRATTELVTEAGRAGAGSGRRLLRRRRLQRGAERARRRRADRFRRVAVRACSRAALGLPSRPGRGGSAGGGGARCGHGRGGSQLGRVNGRRFAFGAGVGPAGRGQSGASTILGRGATGGAPAMRMLSCARSCAVLGADADTRSSRSSRSPRFRARGRRAAFVANGNPSYVQRAACLFRWRAEADFEQRARRGRTGPDR